MLERGDLRQICRRWLRTSVLYSIVVLVLGHFGQAAEAQYSSSMTTQVPEGTKLDALRLQAEGLAGTLPPGDTEDQTRLPAWFRAWWRETHKVSEAGSYQYPRYAYTILARWLKNPNSEEIDAALKLLSQSQEKPGTNIPTPR